MNDSTFPMTVQQLQSIIHGAVSGVLTANANFTQAKVADINPPPHPSAAHLPASSPNSSFYGTKSTEHRHVKDGGYVQNINAQNCLSQDEHETDRTLESTVLTQHSGQFICEQERSFSRQLQSSNQLAWKQRNGHYDRNHFESKIIIPHMEWSASEDRFQFCSPKSLPRLVVNMSVLTSAHRDFNKTLSPHATENLRMNASVSTCTDTGAQTCASGPELLHILNMDAQYLIPTSHRIMGVTQSCMDIMGVVLLRIEANDRVSHQVVYVSSNIKGFFLSQQAQIDLGILPGNYPIPDSYPDMQSTAASTSAVPSTNGPTAACGCRTRTPPPPRPNQIPFPPTAENRDKVEEWLLDYYGSSAFNICEHQPLPKMIGKPLDIHFRSDAKAKAFHCPIPVPHHWKKQVKADLDRDVRLGIIEPVPPGTPTVWCSKMVVVPKKDGTPRRTVDLQYLNAATYRETHHTPSPFNQASVVPPHTKKTVLDAWNGYHSLALSPDASDATTFITEWGRYRYLSSPQGFHAAGDGYTRAFDNITTDFPRKAKCIDDSVLWDGSIEDAFWHTVDYITRCSEGGIIFNPRKFHFSHDEVDFAGFTLTSTGIRPMQQMLSAIRNFPTPTNITGARSWFGLINQVAYAFSMAEEMLPYRDLLKAGVKWYWDETLDTLFAKSKEVIVQLVEKGVRSFEIGRPTCLASDWSKDGVGFVLLQKFCHCSMDLAPNCCKDGWHLIFAGSRFTTDAESRYAPVEGEALAVVYALEKCRMFVLGCPDLLLVVDHKPLLKILGDRSLEDIKNPRLFNLKEKTLMYSYTMKHVPGTWHLGPDACSRYPAATTANTIETNVHIGVPTSHSPAAIPQSSSVSAIITNIREPPTYEDTDISLDIDCYVESYVLAAMSGGGYTEGIDVRAITMGRVKEAAANDSEMQALVRTIINGFPAERDCLPPYLQPYWNLRDELSCIDGVPLYNCRIVVPRSLRTEVLDSLHSAHQGVVGMKARARASVYWPNINAAIGSRRAQCKTCDTIAPSQPPEPHAMLPAPEYPFDQVVADYFSLAGITYLVYADRYTGWVTIHKCEDGSAAALKKTLRMLFGVYGAPRLLSTDGGPPFPSYDVQTFLQVWGVHFRLSSAYYPQSNGRAELSVKVAKRILLDNAGPRGGLDNDKVARALLQHRNTPLQEVGLSPAQLLYGRTLKDCLPSMAEANKVRPEWRMVADDREKALAKRNIMNIERYNEHTRVLPELSVGDNVSVQNQTGPRPNRWEKTGIIVEKCANRQYVIRMDGSGRCTLRNRRFLKKIQPVCADPPMQIPKTPSCEIAKPRPQTTPLQAPKSPHPRSPKIMDPKPHMIEPDSPPSTFAPPQTPSNTPYLSPLPTLPRLIFTTPDPDHIDDHVDPFVEHNVPVPMMKMPTTSADASKVSDPLSHEPLIVSPSSDRVVPYVNVSPRRSTRIRRPRRDLSPTMTGKSHGYTHPGSTSSPD